ncbi:MAG: amidohydrolase [Alteromonadaceae bacterium]|nr:amidohydrolase [Alteromonadaceae bacterium]
MAFLYGDFFKKNKTNSILFILVNILLISGCTNSENKIVNNSSLTTSPVKTMASHVFKNGAIYTVNEQQPWASAIAIKGNKIIYVGSDDNINDYIGNSTKVTDLKGKMMMPGFHDVHIHPIESGSDNTNFILNTNETDAENFIPVIANAAQENPNTEWLIGYGHSIFTLLEANRSPLTIIDEAVADRPIIIMEQTSHSMWVNSAALTRAGIDKNTPDPIGGIIGHDPQTGELNGLLIDNAGNIVMDLAMQPTTASMQRDYDGLVQYTLPELAKNGITSICDARSFWQRDDHLTWLKAQENNKITVRVDVGLWLYPNEDDDYQISQLKQLYSNNDNSLLHFNQIKLYADGIIINTTAAMKDAYHFNLFNLPNNKGLNYFSQQRIEKYIRALEPQGFDFHIHAIGDRGIHEALNAIENAGSEQGRHRITHVEIVDPIDIPRFAQLNITADAQVAGDFTQPEFWHENDEFIGAVKADNLIPLKSLHDAGARVTLSSDWSVSPFNPFIGLQNAITRAPQELTLAQAIQAYTINGAYVMRQENKVGSLEVGKLADLVILDRNLFDVEISTIKQTKILMTMLDGKIIYRH